MKRLFVALTAMVIVMSPVLCMVASAQDAGGAPAPGAPAPAGGGRGMAKAMPPTSDMTVTGKISKEDRPGRGGQTHSQYILTDAAGSKVVLSEGHGPRGKHADAQAPAAPAIDLEAYVGKDVTVVGKGFEMDHNGQKTKRIVEITKIDAAAAAPAAPAPAPAAPAAPAPAPAPAQ